MRPTLNTLDIPLIEQILTEAKRIMAELGMEIRGEKLRRRLLDHGLKTDDSNERILFPAGVVDAAISTVPGSFTLFDRDARPYAEIGGMVTHFVPGSSGLKILDHRNAETRTASSADFVEYIRLCDGLEHISYPATAFSTNDIEPEISDAWRLYLCLSNSLKPVVSGAFTEHGVSRMVKMMQLFRMDAEHLLSHPMSIFTVTPTGRFCYSRESCQNLLDCVEAGIPVEIVPVTLMGMIAPVSLVGSLVFHCVDVLSGIAMAQIIKPGAPVLFGGAPATFHMKTTTAPMAAVEALHLDVAYIEIAKYLGLPSQAYMGLSDARFLDAQAGAETFGSALLAGLSGANSVSGAGMLDYVMTFSLAKLVFDNEICGQVKHFMREIKPVDDLPAIELAREVVKDGHLMTAQHTLEHWQQELFFNDSVIDREDDEGWKMNGSRELLQRAAEEVERRLSEYTPIETDPTIELEMRRIVMSGIENSQDLPSIRL